MSRNNTQTAHFHATLIHNDQKRSNVVCDPNNRLKFLAIVWDIISHSSERNFMVSEFFGDNIMSEIMMCKFDMETMPSWITHFGVPDKGVIAFKTIKGEVILVNNPSYPETRITALKS